MKQENQKLSVLHIKNTTLPLGFKKVFTRQIPSAEVEKKLMAYNRKYRHLSYQSEQSSKPITKIMKYK